MRVRQNRRDELRRATLQLDHLVEDFRDLVVGESGGEFLAAFEPVIVKGPRPRSLTPAG
jgi:hypothetical protein